MPTIDQLSRKSTAEFGDLLPVWDSNQGDTRAINVGALADSLGVTVSVSAFGADGSGAGDDTEAIQAAINASYGKRLYFPEGTYKVTAGLVATAGLHIDLAPDAVIDFSDAPAATSLGGRICLTFAGSGLGDAINVTADVADTATTLTLATTSGLSAGDWIVLRSDQPYLDGVTGDTQRGQITRLKSVDSATQVTLYARVSFTYAAASGARVQKIGTISGAMVTGGKIVCGGVGSGHTGIRVNWGVAPVIDGVTVDGGEDCGVSLFGCIGAKVTGCNLLNSTSSATLGNTGYGLAQYGGLGGSMSGNYVFNCRHGVAGGAATGHVSIGFKVEANDFYACGLGTWSVDCHEPCFNWSFVNNTIIGGQGGAVLRGPGTRFVANSVRDVTFTGVQVQQFGANTVGLPRINVSHNEIDGATSIGIRVVGHTVSTDKILGCTVAHNKIRRTGSHGINALYAVGLHLDGNEISSYAAGSNGVYLSNCTRATIRGGEIDGSTNTAALIYIEQCDRVKVSGVDLLGNTGAAAQDGIRADGTAKSGLIVTGSTASGCGRYGVYTTGTDRVIVTSNDMRDVVSATKILISGATTSVNADNIV